MEIDRGGALINKSGLRLTQQGSNIYFNKILNRDISYRKNMIGDLATMIKPTSKMDSNKYKDLITLAKNNNVEFVTLFNELYPKFFKELLTINRKMRSSELEFCAMAFLNFTTKNIAEFTSVTVRAVQVRKNRLRKKLNIPSDLDFNIWMRALIQE